MSSSRSDRAKMEVLDVDVDVAPRPWPDTSGVPYAKAVVNTVLNGTLTEGRETALLEAEFADWLGAEQGTVVAVSSGTHAVEAALRAAGVDESWTVIVPALTFSGSALGVLNIGAHLRFADVTRDTFNIDPQYVAAMLDGRPTAVVAVDLHGLPANYYSLSRWPVTIIEDACQAYGAKQDGRPAGRLSSRAAFSLNKTKTLFAGEGGLVVLQNDGEAERVREMRRFGELGTGEFDRYNGPEKRWMWGGDVSQHYGSNWKIPEVSAAIARVSLRSLDYAVDQASVAGDLLSAACRESGVLDPPRIPPGSKHAWHKFRVYPSPDVPRERMMVALRAAGVPTCLWQTRPLPEHPAFRDHPDISNQDPWDIADHVCRHTFIIGDEDRPLAALSQEEAERWAEKIANVRSTL